LLPGRFGLAAQSGDGFSDLTMGFPQEVCDWPMDFIFQHFHHDFHVFFLMAVDYNCRYGLEVLCSVKKGKPELRKKVLKGVWGPKLHLAGKHLVDTGVVKLLNF